jgi:hypothetical protein
VFGADPYEWMGPLADVDHQVPPAFATFSPVFKKLRHQYSSPTRSSVKTPILITN